MSSTSVQAKIQKWGGVLSAMVMPNIGIFIGWGLLTALFLETGWIPNEYWAKLITPILTYLLPVMIGYTGGYNVHGKRGGVIGAFATMGVVIGADITMLVGGMIMGPVAALLLKKFDEAIDGHVKPGMEMLVDNFSLGIIGFVLCMIGYAGVAPAVSAVEGAFSTGVNYMCDRGLVPLLSIIVQPSQVLFLNNAINHGIMAPLGIQQVVEQGKSVLFYVEAACANWTGCMIAFSLFGDEMQRKSAPGAAFIMFFGGIAEPCFPFVLSQPLTIFGPMLGQMVLLFVITTFGGGAVGPVSPGSVFTFYMMSAKDAILPNTIGYFLSGIVSFVVTAAILKMIMGRKGSQPALETAGTDAEVSDAVAAAAADVVRSTAGTVAKLDKVVFACDAGMGSSAMGSSILKTRLMKAGLRPQVPHVAISEIPSDADVIVTNQNLAERAKQATGGTIPILTVNNFMDQDEYDRVVKEIQGLMDRSAAKATPVVDAQMGAAPAAAPLAEPTPAGLSDGILPVFDERNIVLGAHLANKTEAINACADLLVSRGYVNEGYRQDMFDRDRDVSVYLGSGVALPHGLDSSKEKVKHSGICFIQVPEGVDFDGHTAYLLIGVAGRGEEHVAILGQVAKTLIDEDNIDKLKKASTKQEVLDILKL